MSHSNSDNEKEVEKPLVAKSAVDLQRLKLMKLMKNPEKAVIIPERPKVKGTPAVPEFVRNVMGSSAGAGSGEFHVYRHLRRKEYARQKFIQEKGQKELLDEAYHKKLEENKKIAEELTAKKRAKRLKKKRKCKHKKMTLDENIQDSTKNDSENESSDEEKCNESENTIEEFSKKRNSKKKSDITDLNKIKDSEISQQERIVSMENNEDIENMKIAISKERKFSDVEERNQIINQDINSEQIKNNGTVHNIDKNIDNNMPDTYKKEGSVDKS